MDIQENILNEIREHAGETSPQECCGVVIVRKGKQRYIRCRNMSRNGRDTFVLHPEDYADAEEQGEVVRIVHSHPYESPAPSQADRVGCESTGIPWLIVNHPLGHYTETFPDGYKAPLVGRQFVHGVLDCYTLVRDYYASLGIELPDFERADRWWDNGGNLYAENFERAGFVRVDDAPRAHDVFLMQVRSEVPNHAAVYLGDEYILHHLHGQLSSKDCYAGYWQKATVIHIRHRSMK